jgi:hypothetical protein
VHHAQARDWLLAEAPHGWASCPITENGFVRIITQPHYPRPISTTQAVMLLRAAASTTLHEFWPADLSLLDAAAVDPTRIHGPRQVTDVYLLALAVQRSGRFVTFDACVPLSAVRGATSRHLVAL